MKNLKMTILVVVIFLAIPFLINYWSGQARQIKQKYEPPPLKTEQNIGITLEEFKKRYNENVLKSEITEGLKAKLLLDNESEGNVYEMGNTVKLVIETSWREDLITEIRVKARPLKNTTREEKVKIMLIQSTVFSLAAMIFNSEIEKQSYREKVIRLLYENMDKKNVTSGNLKCETRQQGDEVIISILPKN